MLTTTELTAVGKSVRSTLVVALAYYALARAGLLFALPGTVSSPLWPASGAALAATVLLGANAGWGVFLGSWCANLQVLAYVDSASAAKIAFCAALVALGSAAQALAGSALLSRFISARAPLSRSGDVILFTVLTPLACIVAASVGVTALVALGLTPRALYGPAWLTWWIGDVVGILTVFPLVLSWLDSTESEGFERPLRLLEAGAAMAGIAFSAWLGFSDFFSYGQFPLSFLPFPILIWATMRLGARGVTLGTSLLAVLVYGQTIHGLGPFAVRLTTAESLLLSSLYLGAAAVTSYLLHALLTERREAEKKLRKAQEEQLRLMIESVQDYAIFRMDAEGRVVTWNKGAQKITGYAADEILGRSYDVFFPPDEILLGKPRELMRRAELSGRSESEGWRLRKDGSRYWSNAVLAAMRDEKERLQGYVKVARDNTERRLLQLALEERTTELTRSNADLTQFAYVASHDLQEPLRKVEALADQLHEHLAGRLDETERDFMARLLGAVRGMQDLIDALLKLARVNVGGAPLRRVDMSALAESVVDDLSLPLIRSGGRVHIDGLPAVKADPQQMRQLLQNLISNAIKFHIPGRPPSVRVSGCVLDDGRCEFRVQDDGVGFDMGLAERLFQPLQRLHSRRDFPGTGMGLAICRKIVERHGGTLSVESAVGRGSTFKVVLPSASFRRVVAAGGGSWNNG